MRRNKKGRMTTVKSRKTLRIGGQSNHVEKVGEKLKKERLQWLQEAQQAWRVELWDEINGHLQSPFNLLRHGNKCSHVHLQALDDNVASSAVWILPKKIINKVQQIFLYTEQEPLALWPRFSRPLQPSHPQDRKHYKQCQRNISASFLLTAFLPGQWCWNSPLSNSQPASIYTLKDAMSNIRAENCNVTVMQK